MHIYGGIDHETQKATIIGEKRVLREGRAERVGDAYDKTAEGRIIGEKEPREGTGKKGGKERSAATQAQGVMRTLLALVLT